MDNKRIQESRIILQVEDESIIALQTEKVLEEYGYSVITASRGEEAVQIIKDDKSIDLVLMDINLGDGIDGTEAAQLILKQRDIPVVFHSSHTEPEIVEKTEKITSYGYIVKNSSSTVLDASIKMAFRLFESVKRQKKLYEDLHDNEEMFHRVLNVIPDMVSINDSEMNILFSNWRGIAEVPKDKQIPGTKCYTTYRGFQNICPDCTAQKVLKTGKPYRTEKKLANGKWADLRIIPILNNNGKCSYFVEWIRDITRWKQASEALAKSEERFRRAIEGARDGLWDWNLKTNKAFFSPRFYEMLGYSDGDLPRTGAAWYELLHPDDEENAQKVLKDYLEKKTDIYESMFRMCTKSGGWKWIISRGKAVWDEDGQPERITGFNTDITVLKKTENDLQKALDRNRALFLELQHRVKNSFSLISSMINLMSEQLKTKEAVQAMEDISSKITALAEVYQLLYLGDSTETILLSDYLNAIINSMPSRYLHININKKIARITASTKKAVNLGLIFSEILTNIYKYAFPDNKNGNISILLEDKDDKVVFEVKDDGVGFPAGFDPEKSESLGIKLIYVLAEEINAEIGLKMRPHTEWKIIFLPY